MVDSDMVDRISALFASVSVVCTTVLDMAVDTAVDLVVDMAVDMAVDTAVDMAVDLAVDTAADLEVDTATLDFIRTLASVLEAFINT
jgi:hypothetical protein